MNEINKAVQGHILRTTAKNAVDMMELNRAAAPISNIVEELEAEVGRLTALLHADPAAYIVDAQGGGRQLVWGDEIAGHPGRNQTALIARPEGIPQETGELQASEFVNLEGLRERLLAPRDIVRDKEGWLSHPDFPVFDEDVNAEKFLEAFHVEAAFVSMESDDPAGAECYFDAGEPDCSYWTPTPPEGEGWMLLDIFDTEDGPHALFGRDAYEVEKAAKRDRTRAVHDRIVNRTSVDVSEPDAAEGEQS